MVFSWTLLPCIVLAISALFFFRRRMHISVLNSSSPWPRTCLSFRARHHQHEPNDLWHLQVVRAWSAELPPIVPTLVWAVDEIADDNQIGVNARVLPPAVPQPTQRLPPRMSLEECIYLLFDVEMTGGSKTDDNITEIAATKDCFASAHGRDQVRQIWIERSMHPNWNSHPKKDVLEVCQKDST